MIEQVIVFAARHKREPSHIGEHGSVTILPIEPEQRARRFELIRCQISANGRKPLAQFFPIASVPAVPETTEPLIAVRLSNRCSCPDDFPTLAAPVARSADVIQPAKGWEQIIALG